MLTASGGTKNDKPCYRNCTTLSYLEASSLLRNKESDLKYRTRSVIPGRIGDPLTGLSPIRGARTKKTRWPISTYFPPHSPTFNKKNSNSQVTIRSVVRYLTYTTFYSYNVGWGLRKFSGAEKTLIFAKKKWFSF